MGAYGRIQKNIENNIIKDVFKTMTFEEYQEGIKIAVARATENLKIDFQNELNKMHNKYENALKEMEKEYNANINRAISIVSVEFLYDVAKELNCFEKDEYVIDEKIQLIQRLYKDTENSIKEYDKYKNEKQAYKEFKKRKDQMEKMFNIKF